MLDRATLRARFLARSNPAPVRKHLAGFGDVFLRVLTVEQADANRRIVAEFPDDDAVRANSRRLAMMLVSEDNEPLFDPRNEEDVAALSRLEIDVVNGLFRDGADANQLEEEEAPEGGKD